MVLKMTQSMAVMCYGPDATNIHGIDESASLESMSVVTAAIALFIRDWCGLEKCTFWADQSPSLSIKSTYLVFYTNLLLDSR
jgi:hypothetical protein